MKLHQLATNLSLGKLIHISQVWVLVPSSEVRTLATYPPYS